MHSRPNQPAGDGLVFADRPGIQHAGSAVPGAGHMRRGDLSRLSVSAGSDAADTGQRMLHGPGCAPGPCCHFCFRVRKINDLFLSLSISLSLHQLKSYKLFTSLEEV